MGKPCGDAWQYSIQELFALCEGRPQVSKWHLEKLCITVVFSGLNVSLVS